MMNSQNKREDVCAIYVDMGTTNTRAWLMRGAHILSRAGKVAGVRDTARSGSRSAIRAALAELIAQLKSASGSLSPTCITAAGMITSQLGLTELPHVQSPAGIDDVAAASRWFNFPEISELSMLLVPGVRSGPLVDIDSINDFDVMRGEETLCLGLVAQGVVKLPSVVLNLGSHWKAVQLDAGGRIEASCTSMSGELIDVVQLQTVLAGSLPKDRPTELNPRWIEAGMKEQRQSGLSRAMFCIRLFDLSDQGSPEERFSFLLGALIATDLDALVARGVLRSDRPVTICGHHHFAAAFAECLSQMSIPATVMSVEQTEHAFLAGLRTILTQATELGDPIPQTKQVGRS